MGLASSVAQTRDKTERVGDYHRRKRLRDRRAFVLFVAPALLAFSFMMLWPLGNTFYLSLMRWQGLLKPKTFVGLDNFVRLVRDRHFHAALANSGVHFAISGLGVMYPAFVLGYFLNLRRPGWRLLRTLFFVPSMISAAGQAMMFLGVYVPTGILNSALRAVGLGSWTHSWLGESGTVLLSVVMLDFYGGVGYYAVLLMAALSSLAPEVREAALLDGAGEWTIMWRIAYPLVLDFFGVCTMLHFLWILLGAVTRVLLLTHGGPGDYSLTLGYYLYDLAFQRNRLGYSQAVGVVIFVIGAIGIALIRWATHRDYRV